MDSIRFYDIECYSHNWLVVIKKRADLKNNLPEEYAVIWDDPAALRQTISKDNLYFGFNTKSYDKYMLLAMVAEYSHEELKALNDWIIGGRQGYDFPGIRDIRFSFNNVDLRDDMQKTLSLKSIEGHFGMDIEETEVPFDIDRPLTEKEKYLVTKYCKHDVDATEALFNARIDYLRTKLNLGRRVGIPDATALGYTNAKLTAAMLKAKYQERTDGRLYTLPENIAKHKDEIPKEILYFFSQIRDFSISDEDLFSRSLEITVARLPCKYGWGGVHGSVTQYHAKATDTRLIQNRDVSSLYPTLLEKYGYLSRNVPDPGLFYQMRKDRIQAKHDGNKRLAKDLKLPLNTVSGAQENQYNDLYDPLPTRSLRITGQLALTILLVRLSEIPSFRPLNFNTDGLMYEIDLVDAPQADIISSQWEDEMFFELELDDIKEVYIKDVNNLLEIKTDGSVKTVGGYLNYGITEKGAWGINNNYTVVKQALIEYMTKGTPVKEYIECCSDIREFQIIAHASSKYDSCFQQIGEEQIPCQKTNRVYASLDKSLGTLYKVKAGHPAKIPNLPQHCIVDNDNRLTIADIDKSWYVRLANKMLKDFIGTEEKQIEMEGVTAMPKKKEETVAQKAENAVQSDFTEEVKQMNVFEKLMRVRVEFGQNGVKKSGRNDKMQFLYFELADIVPTANQLFLKYRLMPLTNFTEETASMGIINIDNPEDMICFTLPMREVEPILNREGKEVTNAVQRLGSVVTYQRRYLYMIALDIVEQDAFDAMAGQELPAAPKPVQTAPKVPATAEERKEIKEELTGGNANKLQISQLKKLFKKLIEAHPEKADMVSQIMIETENLTKISKEDCELTIKGIAEMLGETK